MGVLNPLRHRGRLSCSGGGVSSVGQATKCSINTSCSGHIITVLDLSLMGREPSVLGWCLYPHVHWSCQTQLGLQVMGNAKMSKAVWSSTKNGLCGDTLLFAGWLTTRLNKPLFKTWIALSNVSLLPLVHCEFYIVWGLTFFWFVLFFFHFG